MRKTPLATVATLILGLATSPLALGNEIDDRGYRNCIKALGSEFRTEGLVVDRQIFIQKSAHQKTYFMNGYVWDDSDRARVKLACITSTSGRNVESLVTDSGEYYLEQGGVASR
ncbi:MAG: hypothetical protein WD994_06495 [Pseudomonadales bacterium]